jgi:hypothetical protein
MEKTVPSQMATLSIDKPQQSRALPAVLLAILAPLFGEYLLGNLKFSEIVYLPFLIPLYGAGALLIREFARRSGRGSGTMLILGVAYGLIEEGLVDQMLFNRFYFAGQDQFSDTYIAALGVDAWLSLIVLAMHAIWSTYIPITLVEVLFPEWRARPWLDNKGLTITTAVFLLGSAYLCYTIYLEERFFASAAQLTGTVIVIILLVKFAFSIDGPRKTMPSGFAPNPWIVGGFSLTCASLYMLTEMLSGWTRVAACLVLLTLFFSVIRLWSQFPGWSEMHRLALAGGGILTYAWLGLWMEPESGPKTMFDQIGSLVFVMAAIALVVLAALKLRRSQFIMQTVIR